MHDSPGVDAADELPADVWKLKPAWCQPWSIVATGTGVIAVSWAVLHNTILTVMVTAAIGAWWFLFLGVMPASYAEYIREMRTADRTQDWE